MAGDTLTMNAGRETLSVDPALVIEINNSFDRDFALEIGNVGIKAAIEVGAETPANLGELTMGDAPLTTEGRYDTGTAPSGGDSTDTDTTDDYPSDD